MGFQHGLTSYCKDSQSFRGFPALLYLRRNTWPQKLALKVRYLQFPNFSSASFHYIYSWLRQSNCWLQALAPESAETSPKVSWERSISQKAVVFLLCLLSMPLQEQPPPIKYTCGDFPCGESCYATKAGPN